MRAELRKLYKNYAAKPHQCCRRARSPRRHGRGGERRRRHHGTLGRGSGSMPTRPSSPRRVSIGRRRAAGPHWPGRHRRPHIHSARCTATGSRRRIVRCEPSWTRRTLGYGMRRASWRRSATAQPCSSRRSTGSSAPRSVRSTCSARACASSMRKMRCSWRRTGGSRTRAPGSVAHGDETQDAGPNVGRVGRAAAHRRTIGAAPLPRV